MRLATLQPRTEAAPLVARGEADGTWRELSGPDLASMLADPAALMPAANGRRWREGEFDFLPPLPRPPAFRDFYAFEQHVKTARAKRGLEMIPAWYEVPVFYFSNPHSLIGHEAEVHAPAGCVELDFELELGIVMG